jgi:glycosyltransferase involved in cell wall biosynthesis
MYDKAHGKLSMKIDILILCQYFYPEYISSATLPYDTALKLSQSGYSVDVFTGYPKEYLKENGKTERKEIIKNVSIKRFKYISMNRNNKLGRLINYLSFTFSILLKLRSLKKYEYVFVYSNPPLLPYVAYLGNKFYGIKIVYVLYDIYPEIALLTNSIKYGSLIHKTMNYINKKVYKKLTKLVVLSQDMKDFIAKNRVIEAEKIIVIENWYHKIGSKVFLSKYKEDKFDKIKMESRFKIVYTGNLGLAQNSDLIIDFIKNNQNSKNLSFIIAGHGNKMNELKRLQNDLNFNNLFIFDFLHDDDYEKLLLLADVFLLSLKNELSGLASPSKLYSYLSAGKPTIAIVKKNSHLAKFILHEKIGLVSDSNISSELKDLVIDLQNDKKKYVDMCKNTVNLFNRSYETDIATYKYVELMDNIKEKQKDER